MANLKKREIIILVIAALVIISYAVYALFFTGRVSSKKVENKVQSNKIETFKSELTNDLSKGKLSDFDKYIVVRAGVDNGKDPFMKKDLYRAWLDKDGKVGALTKIIYSGYVESGRNRMAVLNGLEYRTGEPLAEEGYILKQIMPSKVLIFDKRTGSSLEIPIQE